MDVAIDAMPAAKFLDMGLLFGVQRRNLVQIVGTLRKWPLERRQKIEIFYDDDVLGMGDNSEVSSAFAEILRLLPSVRVVIW